jgi:hypothetical protein
VIAPSTLLLVTTLLTSSSVTIDEPVSEDTSAASPTELAARLSGKFRYVGGEGQRQELLSAIERAVQQLNALIRGIGRRRLATVTEIPRSLRYALNAETIEMQYGELPAIHAPADGRYVERVNARGTPMRVSFELRGETLVQRFKGEKGTRTNKVTISEDGTRLTMRVSIKSERLADPLRYRLSYKRVE